VPEAGVNGVSLYYEERGEGDAILGVHGAGSSALFWQSAAARLATRGRTIVYDRRGHGRSERPEPYAVDVHENADDAAALLDALAAAPAVVIARSYGGAIAVDLALRYPDRVRALALLEGDVPAVSETAAREWAELEERLTAAGPDTAGERLMRDVLGDAGWERLPDVVRELFVANGPALVAELVGGYPDVTEEQLAAIDQPVLFVGAEDSAFDYRETAEVLGRSISGARVEWVEGGHAIDPAHPVVLAFVDDVLGR
jgi:pimeloyl-ACP methyl ester carboxylesterase